MRGARVDRFYGVLKDVSLFDKIKRDELELLLNCLRAQHVFFGKEQFILRQGEPVMQMGVVLSGTAQVLREDTNGNRTILTELAPRDLFAEALACAGVESSPVAVRAVSNCEVLLLHYKKIITSCPASCSFHTRLIENMLSLMANKNLLLNSRIDILSQRTMREKMLVYLRQQSARKKSRQVKIPFSRQGLADFLCVERSALSRELCKMREDGLIAFEKNTFTLL